MLLKKDNTSEIETNIFIKTNNDLQNIKYTLDTKTTEELYQNITYCFNNYLNTLLKSNISLTTQEIILKLKKFNIDKSSIDLIETIFNDITQIDYNHQLYSKEDLFNLILYIEKAIEEINIQRKAYHLSISNKLSKESKDKIIIKFQSNLESLKKYNLDKLDASNNLIISLTEYYNYLPNNKKEEFSKEYTYYCKIIPELILLIDDLKKENNDSKKIQLISAIKKLFVKLEDDKKQFFYSKLTSFINDEQKIDFLFSLGYIYLSNKDFDKALQIYQSLSILYANLDNNKKKYYQPIFLRYLSTIKKNQTRN